MFHLDRTELYSVESVRFRNEFGDLFTGRQQDALALGGLHHDIGESAERRLPPRADHHSDSGIGTEAGDVPGEPKSTAAQKSVPLSGSSTWNSASVISESLP